SSWARTVAGAGGRGHGEVVPVVYLVRHAHAGTKATWPGPDLARPLSAQGRKEAPGLIAQLGAEPLGRILSSPAKRCLQTVQPLAERLGPPVWARVLRRAEGARGGRH